ncbi:MAG: NAD(P)/FAD-dependent oxidoreductase [Acidobacteria bacterium]|nr:NAD(P)/FAD-dependent oxidoreductase [Acidobacteriota bacterium]
MNRNASDILIVGGGAAGMSAAFAATSGGGTNITIVDDNPHLGGQIWRAELGKVRNADAAKLIEAIEAGRIGVVNSAQVFAAVSENKLLAETPNGTTEFEYKKLIIATGARERFLPFPGWTLSGVFGAGGLQALVKGGLNVKNKRIVVAGTGPLLLAVADYLNSKGANVVAIVEQASARNINRFALGLWNSPAKLIQAAALKKRLFRIPYLTNTWIANVTCGSPRVSKGVTSNAAIKSLSLNLNRNGKTQTIECDHLACGFHLVPNTELAALLGCKIEDGFVSVDGFQRTSLNNVYCAGEPTAIGGVEASLVEGKIAGYAAADNEERSRELFTKRDKTRRFGNALNTAFALRGELKTLADNATIVCRCEDVQYEKLAAFDDWRTAKLQTRCGMGPCQGRICGPATEFIFGWKPGPVRPPIFPVKLENL